MVEQRISWWDRFLIGIAPDWGLRRVRARASVQLMARHYNAAQGSPRTSTWFRTSSDANVANGPALAALRELSRDLRRNNGWARRAVQVITNNVVGWGILPKASSRSRARTQQALAIWNAWAGSTACDYDGRLNFYGLQRLAMQCIVESGEVVIVRQPAAAVDGLSIPMRLQVLEPDYIDTNRNGIVGPSGGPIVDGVEFDLFGRRVAYWLYTSHPGGIRLMTTRFESVRVPAERVLHVFDVERAGQVRGVSWLASAITRLRDQDDFEDAELMKQKVAACFGAFVTDLEPTGAPLGVGGTANGQATDRIRPGTIEYLAPGKDIKFAAPPPTVDGGFSTRALRRVAASLGITYEDMTGDYSQVNFSSARMARIAHWQNVHTWRWHMLIPQMCSAVWLWGMQLVAGFEGWPALPTAEWVPPPMPILEPDKEGLAYQRLLRIGAMTFPQMVHQLGGDPTAQLNDIQAYNAEFDKRGIVLDSDPRYTTAAGMAQAASSSAAVTGTPLPAAAPAPAAPSDVVDDPGEDEAEDEGVNPADAAAS